MLTGSILLSIVTSDTSGLNWTSPAIVLAQTNDLLFESRIASFENHIVVSWIRNSASGGEAVFRYSRDGGTTWTAEAPIWAASMLVTEPVLAAAHGQVVFAAKVGAGATTGVIVARAALQ